MVSLCLGVPMRGHIVVLVLVLAMLAGCLAPASSQVESSSVAAPPSGPVALDLSGTECWIGGGHSVLPKYDFLMPEPWMPADVLEDVGPQPFYSGVVTNDPTSPIPGEGRTLGNWHATFVCEGWTLRGADKAGALVGLVGARVEPPPFDEGPPAARHYLITAVASDDEDIRAAFHEGGIPAMGATHARTATAELLRIQMWTEANGDYDSIFLPKDMGAMEPDRFRFWFQHNGEGHDHTHADEGGPEWRATGEFHPYAIDLAIGGAGRHVVAEANGYFTHSGSGHHNGVPATANTAALLYEGFDATLEWGPRPDVALAAAYVH